MKISKKITALVGALLFAFILLNIDTAKVLGILSGINWLVYSASLCALAFVVALKGLKWKTVLESQGQKIPLLFAIKVYLIGLFLSNITPGKIGDFAKALYLKESTGIPAGIASALLDRLMDVGILVSFSIVASGFFIYLYHVAIIPIEALALMVLAFASAIFILSREKYARLALKPVFNLLVPEEHRASIAIGFSQVFESIKSIRKRPWVFAYAVLLGIILWFSSALVFYSLSVSLSIKAPLEIILLVYPLVSLVDLLPISFSGVGTRDAALIFLFSFFSIPAESAVALSLLVFFTGYVLVSIAGFILFLKRPLSIDF